VSPPGIEIRRLEPAELARVGEIDRTERIDALYVQRGTKLEVREGDWSSPPWDPHGDGEYSVAARRAELAQYLESGATALGAFLEGRLVGIGVVLPHLRPAIAQLAFLHVTDGCRGSGIGAALTAELERIAVDAGDTEMVVSATPSLNTVRFYRGRGYEPMAEPLPELFEHEPEDVHLSKRL
jgi:GNAT superfamily N-acetyltransferase